MTMLSGALQAQDAEFLWAKTYHGREVNQENKDRIASVKTDSIGNVYMFGSFGQAARIDGEHICLMEDDTNYANVNTAGIFLAKFDTLGTMQWCRSARYRGNGYSGNWNNALDMVLKNGKIYIFGELTLVSNWNLTLPDWCWFFDTLYVCPECYNPYDWPYMETFPFRELGHNTVFVVFDLDGNKLGHHTMQLFVDDEGVTGDVHISKPIRGRFVLDSDDNILLFTNINSELNPMIWDSVHTPYLIVDDDTANRISLGLENHFNNRDAQLTSPMLWKIDRNWQHVECKLLIDSVAGWSRRFKVDSVYRSYDQRMLRTHCDPASFIYNGLTIDEQDHVYVSGQMNALSFYTYYEGDTLQELTLPCRFFLDSTHYLTAENLSMLGSLPFVIQYDRDGNVLWCNQLYSETPLVEYYGTMTMSDCVVDSCNLYVEVATESPYGAEEASNVFFDPEHLDTFPKVHHYISGYLSYTASYAIYNKETGSRIAHHTIDTNATTCAWKTDKTIKGSSAIKGDYLLTHIGRGYAENYANYVVKYNKHTGLSTISQPMVTEYPQYRDGWFSLYAHSHGFVIRTSNGSAIHQPGMDTVFCQDANPAFLLFYYDSTLDCRRPHATPPTPPDPPDPPEDSTAVHPVKAPAVTFSLTPNPTTGEVTIEVKGDRWKVRGGEMAVTVCDASGREVRRQTLLPTTEDNRLRLDLKGLPAGAYFVTVVTPQGSHTEKLVMSE